MPAIVFVGFEGFVDTPDAVLDTQLEFTQGAGRSRWKVDGFAAVLAKKPVFYGLLFHLLGPGLLCALDGTQL